ncbi:MAG: hypothetical protein Q8919_05935 [Bacteroidota bacterium]|nr:hypothetical protein [Bacteroidota bacterium]
MRFKTLVLFSIVLFGCARSEKLDSDEMNYVQMTLALTRARVAAHDTIRLRSNLDSVFKKYGTSKTDYTNRTMELGKDAGRAAIIFRAIADSLNVK